MDIVHYNSLAWDRQVEQKNQWTIPVSSETVAAARTGKWKIFLTPMKPVPHHWFPALESCDVLCLASGGGQQGPILAAAGARVTVFDNSRKQLEQDRYVAQRDALRISTVKGDVRDLSVFPDSAFDLIVHPVSNVFFPELEPVWSEAFRVLKPGGSMLSGFMNPAFFLFVPESTELKVAYALPYADVDQLTEQQQQEYIQKGIPFEYGHTLEAQIGGQIEAGFTITGFYEDRFAPEDNQPLSRYMATFMATRAQK